MIRKDPDEPMKCTRCGTDEDRIDGYCSIECKDAAEYEREIADLQADLAKCREALRMLEWCDNVGLPWDPICHWCDGDTMTGHKPDCPRQAALESEK